MTTHVPEVSQIITKSFFVLRQESVFHCENNHYEYLKKIHGVGYRFSQGEPCNLDSVIVDSITGKESVICVLKTEQEAKDLLVKVFNDYYGEHEDEVFGNNIEIVEVLVNVSEEVVKISPNEVLSLNKEAVEILKEFETYLISTAYGNTNNIDERWLKEDRKNNLSGYKNGKIDGFFKTWKELNSK